MCQAEPGQDYYSAVCARMVVWLQLAVEKADGNYSFCSLDLPGGVATGATREEITRNMHEVIEMHVRGLLEDNFPVLESHAFADTYVQSFVQYCRGAAG